MSEQELAPNVQSAIERAKARVASTAIVFDRTYFGEPFEFRFLPTLNQAALEIVSRVQKMATSTEPDVMAQLQELLNFMDVMATDETAQVVAELGRSGVMTLNDLVDLQMAVVESITARPTTRSSSSPAGSSESGETSMASAPVGASTPQPSPLTAS